MNQLKRRGLRIRAFKEHLSIFPELSLNIENQDSNSGTTIMLGVGLAGFLY